MLLSRGISLLIGYLFGMFLSGYMIGKKKDVDLRKQGSGNVGTTNTLRILGMKAGVFTLLCDILKPILAVLVVWLIFRNRYSDGIKILELYAACGAILGHDFPFYMHFKGGKGVASSVGLILVIFPEAFPACFVLFFLLVGITRYVSLGSISCAILLPVEVIAFAQLGWLQFPQAYLLEAQILSVCVGALVIILHRANIKRLISGTENKLSFHKK